MHIEVKAIEIEKEILAQKAQLLDVREPAEWDEGHLKIAKSVPLSLLEEGDEPDASIDPDMKTYLHCRSGNRVMTAIPLLENLGFSDLIPLSEGFEELVASGLERS